MAWPSSSSASGKNAILLSNVQQLVLRGHGALTTHRRAPAAPQLSCLSSPAICRLAGDVDVMRCASSGRGYSSEDIQWECAAALPSTLRLTSTQVVCEGYSSADDEHVLRGSCGVEYRVALTDEGIRKYPSLAKENEQNEQQLSPARFLVTLVVVFAAFYTVAMSLTSPLWNSVGRWLWGNRGGGGNPRNGPQHQPRRGFRGGGNGFDSEQRRNNASRAPPPPYTAYDDASPATDARDQSSKSSSSSNLRPGSGSGSRSGFGTGFATGAAAGAAAVGAAGYAASRTSSVWNNARTSRSGGSSWFGTRNTYGRDHQDSVQAGMRAANQGNHYQTATATSSSTRSSSPEAATAVQSTGYGGTSRR